MGVHIFFSKQVSILSEKVLLRSSHHESRESKADQRQPGHIYHDVYTSDSSSDSEYRYFSNQYVPFRSSSTLNS